MTMSPTTRLVLALMAIVLGAGPAAAHPHILAASRTAVVFDDQGRFSELRHEWRFDPVFSAWQIQGLDTNGDGVISEAEMQELADQDIVGLGDYNWYTFASEGDNQLKFSAMPGQRMNYVDGKTVMWFSLKPEQPYAIRDTLEIAVADPEYYVALTFPDDQAISLVNAPDGCSIHVKPPAEMDPEIEQQLYALGRNVKELPLALSAAVRSARGAMLVTCAGGTPPVETAEAAVNALGQGGRSTPFGGPPAEFSLPLPRTGFLGWVADQQRDFYVALTEALAKIKADGSAFWLLGGLSFLYGIFHAAGPGHGKVVISSYMLANEAQVRRGIALSFMSAMMQSAVAVAFVVVAVAVLKLSSFAMSDASWWISTGSYAMVALLGLWLIAQKLFGWGHSHVQAAAGHDHHDHDHDHHHDHDHDHGHDHAGHDDHVHVVTPAQVTGSWREQLGVVLAVGLRPCSGALVVLVFALSQGLLAAGIAAVFLMGLGTAITVAVLATIAVAAKGLAQRLNRGSSRLGSIIVWWLELLGAVAVFAFGVILVLASV